MQVAPHPTLSTPEQTARAFHRALATIGLGARGDVLALLMALSDLETRSWEATRNWNLGNIIVLPEYADQVPWYAGIDNGNDRRFRSYDSLNDGAEALLSQLTRDSRPQWRKGLLTGSPRQFVLALAGKRGGPAYFEADPERYLKGFLARYKKWEGLAGKRSKNTPLAIILAYLLSGAGTLIAALLAARKRR